MGRVALVTGASTGIGADIARTLAIKGMKVIAVARRLEKLQELAADVKQKCNATLHPMRCDVQKEEDILEVFKWAEKHLGGVDVLINNAAIASLKSLTGEFLFLSFFLFKIFDHEKTLRNLLILLKFCYFKRKARRCSANFWT